MSVSLPPLPAPPRDYRWPTKQWQTAEPGPGVDRVALGRELDRAMSQPEALGQTNAVVVVQHGRIVAEAYGPEHDAGSSHISWSMAKSMLHAAFGIALREGLLDPGARASVPEWRDPQDPRHAITVDQLLHMRSGLTFVEDYVQREVSHVGEMLFGAGKEDMAAYAASLPLAHPPGSVYGYASGTSNILSRLLADALGVRGEAYRDFLVRELFAPLGMQSAEPRFDGAGVWVASSYVFATARDFARFGLLYLYDGRWDGRRLLPEGWVDHGRTPVSHDDETGLDHGAHWWIVPGELGIFRAGGYNGQRIAVVPALDLVLVRLGVTPIEKAPELERWTRALLEAFRAA